MTLSITRGRGFHLTFPSGWVLSVQIGGGNYCNNYSMAASAEPQPSNTFEAAAWFEDHSMVEWNNEDTVIGYVPTDRLPALIAIIEALPAAPLTSLTFK